jgi:hypothetical protein
MTRTCGAIALMVALAGCAKEAPGDVERYAQGDPRIMPVVEGGSDGGAPDGAVVRVESWATGAWDGAWMPYPAHAQLDIDHGLGRVPQIVAVYLSFWPDGSTPAQAAGDLARLIEVDERHVVVWNDTNTLYYARVVLK